MQMQFSFSHFECSSQLRLTLKTGERLVLPYHKNFVHSNLVTVTI